MEYDIPRRIYVSFNFSLSQKMVVSNAVSKQHAAAVRDVREGGAVK
jgi:hypothetical protein